MEKQRWEESEKRREEEKKKEDQRRERVSWKKMQAHEKVEKSRFTVFFQWFVAPEGRKSRLAKAAGAEPSGYSTLHYTTLRCTTLIIPHHNYNCNYNCNYTTLTTLHYNYNSTTLQLQLQLHYTNYTTTPLHYNYNYSCGTPHYTQQLSVRWPLQPLQLLQKTQLQPPFGPSVDSLCHPCIKTTHLSYSFLSLKLLPPPCAALLVFKIFWWSDMFESMSRRFTGCSQLIPDTSANSASCHSPPPLGNHIWVCLKRKWFIIIKPIHNAILGYTHFQTNPSRVWYALTVRRDIFQEATPNTLFEIWYVASQTKPIYILWFELIWDFISNPCKSM